MNIVAQAKQRLKGPASRRRIRTALNAIGFDTTDWVRVVMYRRCFDFIKTLDPGSLDVLEIAAGPQWTRIFAFKSYTGTEYPSFDICAERLPDTFDLIVADQVFEHLRSPHRAGKNVYDMLRPGGYFIVTTPFMIRVHASPIDCSRWTEEGMSYLLEDCGFSADQIKTDSWGNRACIKANFLRWPRFGWGRSLRNEPNFPAMVWAFARK